MVLELNTLKIVCGYQSKYIRTQPRRNHMSMEEIEKFFNMGKKDFYSKGEHYIDSDYVRFIGGPEAKLATLGILYEYFKTLCIEDKDNCWPKFRSAIVCSAADIDDHYYEIFKGRTVKYILNVMKKEGL